MHTSEPSELDFARLSSAAHFLSGGGEMGRLIRSRDWSATPLGRAEQWPQSLRSAVSILLPSRAQICLFWGPDLVAIYNDAYRPTLGMKHPRALGQPARVVWSEIWQDVLRPLLENVLKTGEAFWGSDYSFFLERHGYAEETYFDISYDPVRDESGSVGGVFCIVSETTGHVIGQRRLRTLRDLGRISSEARSVDQVFSKTADVLDNNQFDLPFALLYQVDATGSIRCTANCGIDSRRAEEWPLTEASEREVVLGSDRLRQYRALPGTPWPEPARTVVILPIHIPGQPPFGYLVAGVSPRRALDEGYTDFLKMIASNIAAAISAARVLEEQRARAEALAEIDRAKTAFFSNVSHEFRTPLTLMLGPIEEFLSEDGEPLSPSQRQRLQMVHRNALRLQKLVNTLLEFSRIEAGRVQASYQPTDLALLTAELASNFRSACQKAGIDLIVNCPPLHDPVYVDRDMWEKIVLNLISNAFKFTLEGRIEVRLRCLDRQVELTVRDTGIGIPSDQLPHLFERFRRIEGSCGRSQEGSGIGLALVRELVRLHGGEVHAASEDAKGSVFTVTIPLGTDHLPSERIRSDRTLTSIVAAAAPFVEEALRWLPGEPAVDLPTITKSTCASAAGRPLILLADDNADMREYVHRLLAERYEVLAVANGVDALDTARERPPDLVLSDVMMPGLDGFGLLRELRADPRTQEIPVLLLSARAGEEARVEGLQAGADDYLTKPFSARELTARVSAHLELASLRRQTREQLRQSQERFRSRAREQTALYELTDRLQHAGPMSDVFDAALDSIIAALNCHRASVLLDDEAGVKRFVGWRGLSDGYRRAVEGSSPWQRDEKNPWPVCINDIETADLPESLKLVVKAEGIGAVSLIPLIANGALIGRLMVYFDCPHAFSEEELELSLTIARQLAFGIERKRAEEERRQSENRVHELLRELRQADHRKDEFLATLAHELRNPLAPIRNSLELMKRSPDDERLFQQSRDTIERQVRHLVRMVDDLLDVSRISQNKLELRKERIDLAAVVQSAVETSRPLIEAARQRLSITLPSPAVLLDADPVRLAQVFSNLLNNASKYSEPGAHIWLTALAADNEVLVRVRDTGIGIPSQELSRIFELFVQVDRSLERSKGGLGIGLTLVQRLIQMHGGTIEVRSDGPGSGAEFTVHLPLPAQEPIESISPRARWKQATQQARRRILVADDNRDSADTLSKLLRLLGHEVVAAYDGRRAVELVVRFQPDVALLDLGMPELNGYDAARMIRLKRPGNLLLIALTGWGQEEDRRRTKDAGFDHHLVKPVELATLQVLLSSTSNDRDALPQ